VLFLQYNAAGQQAADEVRAKTAACARTLLDAVALSRRVPWRS
jgi:hypothetical protein